MAARPRHDLVHVPKRPERMPVDAELVRLVRRPSSPIRLRSWSGELAEMRGAGEEANGSGGGF
jgi:hypothetical protein